MDRLSRAYAAVASVAIAVAVYHAYDEITGNFNSCNVNPQISCGNVFASGDVSILGVPFYALGLVWFPLVLGLGIWFAKKNNRLNGEVLVPILMIGNAFTIYLWYLELVVIGAICPVCVTLYALNYALTGLSFVSLSRAEP